MNILKGLSKSIGYLAEGALEIFSPDHDFVPPAIGTQSYSGERYLPSKRNRYHEPIENMSKPA